MPVKVIAKTGVGIRLYEAVTISAKGDLRWTKVREGGWRRKYGETDWAFSSNRVYCWVIINMKHLSALWYEDNNPTEIQKKKKRGQWGRRPSHLLHTWMAQKCWPLSGCQNPFLKNDHSAWLLLFYTDQATYWCHLSVYSTHCIIFCSGLLVWMINLGESQLHPLWPSARSWFRQSLALQTAERTGGRYSKSSEK